MHAGGVDVRNGLVVHGKGLAVHFIARFKRFDQNPKFHFKFALLWSQMFTQRQGMLENAPAAI